MGKKKLNKLHITIWCLVGIFAFSTGALAMDELVRLLVGIRSKYKAARSLKIPYKREVISKTMAMLGTKMGGDLASGYIFFMPPDLIRVEQKSPREEILVTNGKSLWWYIPSEKKVHLYSSEQFSSELKALNSIWTGFTKNKKAFTMKILEKTPDGDSILELMPDPPWEQVDRIRVKVSPQFDIKSVDIINPVGTTTKFYFGEIIPVANLNKEFFEFVVPDGVKVVHEANQ